MKAQMITEKKRILVVEDWAGAYSGRIGLPLLAKPVALAEVTVCVKRVLGG